MSEDQGGMSMPKEIKVGPLVYRVTSDPREWQDDDIDLRDKYGYTDHRRGLIFVDAGEASPSMCPVILLHEVMHAAAFAAGQLDNRKRKEEAWVEMVAPLVVAALRESPGLLEFIANPAASNEGRIRPYTYRSSLMG
jgi:hypothetical protein